MTTLLREAAAASPRPTRPPGLRSAAVRQLARVEFIRLLRHPIVLLGAALSIALLATFNRGQLPELSRYSTYTGLGLAPLAFAAVIAAHLNTSRVSRDNAHSVFAGLSLTTTRRITAHLIAAVAPAAIAAVVTIGYLTILFVLAGAGGTPNMTDAAHGVFAVWVGATVGTAAGVWLPGRAGGFLAAAGLAIAQVVLHDFMTGPTATLHWLALWRTVLDYTGADLWLRPSLLHLVYLAALAGLFGALALRRSSRYGGTIAAVVAAVCVVAAGAAQLPAPTAAEAKAVLDQIDRPAGGDECHRRGHIRYCLFKPYTRWAVAFDRLAAPVMSAVPEPPSKTIAIVQRRDRPTQLVDELGWVTPAAEEAAIRSNELTSERVPGLSDDPVDEWPIYVGEQWSGDVSDLALAVAVAHRAVGLPTEMRLVAPPRPKAGERMLDDAAAEDDRDLPSYRVPERIPIPCYADGQARAVIALWLAARAEGLADILPATPNQGDMVFSETSGKGRYRYVQWARFDPFDGTAFGTRSPVIWGPAELQLAHQLLRFPDAEVVSAVQENWARWTAPEAHWTLLVDHFDLAEPPTATDRLRRLGLAPAKHAQLLNAYPNSWHPPDANFAPDPPMKACA